MPSLTVRNIPDETMARLRSVSKAERRSVNSEALLLLERGLAQAVAPSAGDPPMSRSAQLAVWRDLCGSWEDDRSAEEIVADIVERRTMGREVAL